MRVGGLVIGAAALLLCGCDYWRNLTGSKTVTKVPLTITALDAWDSRPIAGALCQESARNLSFVMDGQGRAILAEAHTGNYSLSCLAEGYHNRILDFEVGGKGAAVSVPYARLGLIDWYPEEPEKRPRILVPGPIDTIRYPSKFDLHAFPRDSSGNFKFEWTFAKNPRLNRAPRSIFSSLPYYRMDVDPAEVRDGPDMITVKVRSRLAGEGGDTGYVAGIDSLPIVWVRNKLPTIKLDPPDLSFKLGCNEYEFLVVPFEASDPDGSCTSVVFYSKDTTLALGRVLETRTCTDPNPLVLPLRNPFLVPRDVPLFAQETLGISVWDENGEHLDTSIQFTTFTNVLPTISAERIGSQTEFFTFDTVSVWLEAKDSDGTVEYLEIDWGDDKGRKNITLKTTQADSLRDTVVHSYPEPGNYLITAYVIDACNNAFSIRLRDSIRIRKNTPPSIQVEPQPSLPSDTAYFIKLTIRDKDVEDKMDRYKNIQVDWRDGQKYRDSTVVGGQNPYANGLLLSHSYAGPPPDVTGDTIYVEVTDGQGARTTLSVLIPVQARP